MNDILFKTVMLKGDKGDPGNDGAQISSIEKTASVGLIDTYTITLSDGSTTQFEIKNGEDAQLYEIPQGSVIAYDEEIETTATSYNSNELHLTNVNKINTIKIHGLTEQKSLTGKNLYNKNDASLILNGNLTYQGKFSTSDSTRTICLPVNPNTTYTVSKIQSARFGIASYSEIPSSGTTVNNYTYSNTGTALTLTTGATDNYILAFVWYSDADTMTLQQILDTVQIETGSTATTYEPYCGGVPSPNPDYPQAVEGVGELQQDETYTLNVTVTDSENNTYNLTAAGLTAPVYDGDILDILNGTITRVNGFIEKAVSSMNNSEDFPGWINSGIRALIGSGKNQNYTNPTVYCNVGNNFSVNTAGLSNDTIFLPKTTYSGLTQTQWVTNYPDLIVKFVFPLSEPTTEPVTITGDIAAIKNLVGDQITITAPQNVTTVQSEFIEALPAPDGYEDFDAHWDNEITPGSTWAPETRAVYNELYFKNGDEIITGDNVDNPAPELLGYCKTYSYNVVLQLPKRLKTNQTVTVEQLSSIQIYTDSGSSYVSPGSYEISVKIVRELNQLKIAFKRDTALPNTDRFCVITGQLKITISEEV